MAKAESDLAPAGLFAIRVAWLGDGGFFFSSRRRHTRLQGDWSSDVCSSDLCVSSGSGAPRDVRPCPSRDAGRPFRGAPLRLISSNEFGHSWPALRVGGGKGVAFNLPCCPDRAADESAQRARVVASLRRMIAC